MCLSLTSVLIVNRWHTSLVISQVYELLLGVTALSLLTTPLVILLTAKVLRLDLHAHQYHAVHAPPHTISPLYIIATKPGTPRISGSGGASDDESEKKSEGV